MAELSIISGDITVCNVDAIVNAANCSLLGGGGVDGAIHRAAGTELLKECMTLNGCKTGQAKITDGYNLKAKHVIHTVGPVYNKNQKEECEKLLKSCYEQSLKLALENNCKTVAFPLISAGVYHYPKDQALNVAVESITGFKADLKVVLVLFDGEALYMAKTMFPELFTA